METITEKKNRLEKKLGKEVKAVDKKETEREIKALVGKKSGDKLWGGRFEKQPDINTRVCKDGFHHLAKTKICEHEKEVPNAQKTQ